MTSASMEQVLAEKKYLDTTLFELKQETFSLMVEYSNVVHYAKRVYTEGMKTKLLGMVASIDRRMRHNIARRRDVALRRQSFNARRKMAKKKND